MIYLWGMEKVYVYLHRRKDNGQVFYVGIGRFDRPQSKHHRNKFWHNIVNKYDYDIEIIYKVDTWIQACIIEMMLIEKYGRRDLGLGTLVNMTDGGDGSRGLIFTDEIRKKISNDCKNRVLSNTHKSKISESNKGEKNGFYGKKHNTKTLSIISKHSKGSKNGNSKLTEEDVLWIRKNGVKGKNGNMLKISKKFNVSRNMILDIMNRKNWKHI